MVSADVVLQIVKRHGAASSGEVPELDLTLFPDLEQYAVDIKSTAQYQALLGG
jgi:hypothetical protein